MVDSNVIIWSLLHHLVLPNLYTFLFVLCHCVCFMFFVVVIRRSCEASYIVVVTVGSSSYFLSHFGQLELLDDFLDLVA
jgi:hypothetical protein